MNKKSIGIACYTLRVKEKSKGKYVNLGFSENSITTRDFFSTFLGLIRDGSVDKNNKMVLKTERIDNAGYVIKGIINFGDYGYSAQGFNVVENEISYNRNNNDSELTPHYFLVYLPDKLDTGIILLQRFGTKGIFTALKDKLRSEFTEKFPNYMLIFNPQVPVEVINYLKEGELKSIKVTRYFAPDDIADTLKNLGFERQDGVIITEVKARKKATLLKPTWLTNFTNSNGSSFFEISSENIPDGEIQISVDYLGKIRKIRFDNPRKISPYVDATDALEITDSGHPSFDSIDGYCEDLLDRLLSEMGLQRHV